MSGTIEEFVAKLQAEGVQAGKQAADDIIAKAGEQAKQIVADANAQAKKIIDDAKTQADSTQTRSQTQLDLACRDGVLRLRAALNEIVMSALRGRTAAALTDGELIGGIIHDMIMLYAKAGKSGGPDEISLNVQPQLRDKVSQWVDKVFSQGQSPKPAIDIKAELAQAGFELKLQGEKYEVSVESVVELMAGMVNEELAGRVRTQGGSGKQTK